MRSSSFAACVVAAVLSCARQPPPPILHLADNSDIPPDELGLGVPSAAPSASIAPTPIAPPAPAASIEHAPLCAPPAKPPAVTAAPHRIRSGPPITNYIPPQIIMRPIRARAACFRACYLAALARDPAMHGRIVVHYVIEEDGWVRTANVGNGTDLPDDVAKCVAEQFVGLLYPFPDGGRVEVHYPIAFEP
jgi:hypothetical protein